MGAPNSLNLNCKVRVMKEAPDPSVSEEIVDIFRNYDIDNRFPFQGFSTSWENQLTNGQPDHWIYYAFLKCSYPYHIWPMDYVDPDVLCLTKADKLNHSPHPITYQAKNKKTVA